MTLFAQLFIGAVMIGMTVVFQAMALDFIIRRVHFLERVTQMIFRSFWRPFVCGGVVVSIFCAQIVIIWAWAAMYLLLQCTPLHGLSDALYFATTTYTTLGFGDVVLGPSCRMMAGIESANGVMLFGWTTAFVFEVVSQLYRKETRSL